MKNFFVQLLPVLFLLGSCGKDKKEFVGPEYVAAGSAFKVETNFSPQLNQVNLVAGNVQYFNATFSERATWTITLNGKVSGAVKVINGLSNIINASNSSWTGGHDDLLFFKNGEEIDATLTIFGYSEVYKGSFILTKAKVYEGATAMGSGFENFTPNNKAFGYSPFFDSGEMVYGGTITDTKLEGGKAFKLSGIDKDNSYHIGLVRVAFPDNYSIPVNTKDLWVNVYVYGNESQNGVLNVALKHDTYTANANGIPDGYVDDNDDSFEYPIALNFKGWKLFSIRYSDFTRSTAAKFGGSGPNIKDPSKLKIVDFALQSKPSGGAAEAIFDYPTITFGHPFIP